MSPYPTGSTAYPMLAAQSHSGKGLPLSNNDQVD